MNEKDQRPTTINMLLDVDRFSGEHTGRLAPIMVFLLLAGAPALIIIYFFVGKVNLLYIIPFYVVYLIRLSMIMPGQERKRVEQFKRQLHDVYSSIFDLMNIKTIHPDGCVEYTNGTVAYHVVATNGSVIDEIMRAQIIRKFLIHLNGEFTADIHVHNIVASDELSNRYDGVKLFNDNDAAADFIAIIDHNREIISTKSLITEVIFVVKARKRDFKRLKQSIEIALASDDAKVFKAMKMEEYKGVNKNVSRDINAFIEFEEVQRKKYKTGAFYGSKVVGYDVTDVEEVKEETVERGFMVHE